MNTSLSKARAGVFLLLIAISLYSLFMISASNNSYAAGQSLFKFSSLIGLSPSANGYDRQALRSNLADKLISKVNDIDIPSSNTGARGITALDAGEVAQFLSSPRKSKFRSRNLVAGSGVDGNGNINGIIPSNLLLAFNGANGGVNSGLVSECIQSLQPDRDTKELIVAEVIACIINGGGDANLLADNGNDPFGNAGNGIDDLDNLNGNNGNGNGDPNGNNGNGGNGGVNADNGNGGNGDPNGNNGNGNNGGNNGEPNGNNGDPVVLATVPEPSTYMLFGLGLIGLVGFSRKKVKARIS